VYVNSVKPHADMNDKTVFQQPCIIAYTFMTL